MNEAAKEDKEAAEALCKDLKASCPGLLAATVDISFRGDAVVVGGDPPQQCGGG